ncbi:MAG: MlaD family protein [Solirubrobacteraceae bacterium]
MTPHLDRPWVAATIALWAVGAVLFVILNNAFGGPTIGFSSSYAVSATVADAEGLLTKSVVLDRGVVVGSVSGRELVGDRVRFTLALDGSVTPLYRDATVSVRKRTLFGEPYVDLDRGNAATGRLPSGATIPAGHVQPTVQLDQALQALDAPTRQHLSSLGHTGADVASDSSAVGEFSSTVDGFGSLLEQLRRLGATLDDQHAAITQFVSDGSVVLTTLGDREAAIRQLVGQGRITAETFLAQRPRLEAAIAEVPRLLRSARLALRDAAPVLQRAQPVLQILSDASPSLVAAFDQLPATAAATRSAIAGLPGLRAAAVPVLHELDSVVGALSPATARLEPFLRDLVPIVRYAAPYGRDLVGLVGGAGAGVRYLLPDGRGAFPTPAWALSLKRQVGFGTNGPILWGRFLVDGDPAYTADAPDAFTAKNPYPGPADPFSAYVSGSYPHLMPYPAFR